MQQDVVAQAHRDALLFLRRFGVRDREDILPEPWADSYGIEIVEAPLDGASAQLIRLANVVQIVLSDRITDYCARRFAIVHELYHFLKRHPSSPTVLCKPKWMRQGKRSTIEHEIGSNTFAGAVLLPEFLLRRRCEVSPVSLEVAHQIAKEYDVSILTSAIRFAELASERCAAVFSKNGIVQWAAESPTFTERIAKGTRLSRESVAWDFHASGRLDDRAQPVPGFAWFDTDADVEIVEQSIGSAEHGTVLSLLWIPEAVASELGMA